jgi:hypothetical protein
VHGDLEEREDGISSTQGSGLWCIGLRALGLVRVREHLEEGGPALLLTSHMLTWKMLGQHLPVTKSRSPSSSCAMPLSTCSLEVGRRWHGDGTEMARRWHGDGTEMARRWQSDHTEITRRCDGDGSEMAARWQRDGSEMAARWQGDGRCSGRTPWVFESSPLRCTHQPREVDEALHGATRRADHLLRIRVGARFVSVVGLRVVGLGLGLA